jgi:hypothetical protein
MKKWIITLLLILVASPAMADRYCKWENDMPKDCQREGRINQLDYLELENGTKIARAAYNRYGFYKVITERPPLAEGNRYAGHSFTFDGSIIVRTIGQVPNIDGSGSLKDFKIQKYQSFKSIADGKKEGDCSYGGFTIPEETRMLMTEAIVAGKTVTYEVMDESTGFYKGFVRTPAQAKVVLDSCLTDFESASRKLYIDNPDTPETGDGLINAIKACVTFECVDSIEWDYIPPPSGTN